MTSLTALDARTTVLEYAVFEQFPHTMEAMTHGSTQVYAVTVENREAIAGLRVDMAALQTSLHHDMFEFKATLDLQGDRLREAIAVATAEYRASLTGVRETMSLRFQKVDGQFNGVNGDIANLQSDVTAFKEDAGQQFAAINGKLDSHDEKFASINGKLDSHDEKFASINGKLDTLDAKLDALISEIRGGKN